MGFVKMMDEIAARHRETADFFDAEVLTVFFETNAQTIERLIPSPLKPDLFQLGQPLLPIILKLILTYLIWKVLFF